MLRKLAMYNHERKTRIVFSAVSVVEVVWTRSRPKGSVNKSLRVEEISNA
jgi:hypothetical protein